jgi:hypothetical protein
MKVRVAGKSPTKKVMIKTPAGEDPPAKTPGLNYDQINLWSDYVEKNPGKDLQTLYKGFVATNPKAGVDFNTLQSDLEKLTKSNIRLAEKTGSDVLKDKGGIHTGYSFPKMVIGGKDYGRVNSDLKTQISIPPQTTNAVSQSIPQGAESWFDEKEQTIKYIDPQTGDVINAGRSTIHDPRIRASIMKQKEDMAARQNATASLNKILSGK